MHPRGILIAAAACGALGLAPSPAAARSPVKKVQSTITVKNATATAASFGIQVKLSRGTKLSSLSGAKASARKGTVALTARKPVAAGGKGKVVLVTSGKGKPAGWTMPGGACKAKAAGRKRSTALTVVTCTITASAGATTTPSGDAGTPSSGTPASTGTQATETGATSTGGSTPGGQTPPATPAGDNWFRFAPYTDMTFTNPVMPAAIKAGSGATHASLGFVVAKGDNECIPSWGSNYKAASGGAAFKKAEISAIRDDVTISFGGQSGKELARVCGSVADLLAAYKTVVDAYGVTHLDFDVEGASVGETANNDKRSQAIAQLQAQNPAIKVSYTIDALPDRIEPPTSTMLQNVVDRKVKLSLVNAMAMNFGSSNAPNGGTGMGGYAKSTGETLKTKLKTLIPSLSDAEAYRMVGVTVMIGQNNDPTEVFRLADATTLTGWATEKHIGMVSMWSAARDKKCATNGGPADAECSSVDQQPWDFSKKLLSFGG